VIAGEENAKEATAGKRQVAAQNRSYRRWILARKIVQGISLVGFLVLFVLIQHPNVPRGLVKLPIWLDPLAVLVNLIASRTFVRGMMLALVTVGLTLVFGRAWCGWLCPLGTVLDLFPLRRSKIKHAGKIILIKDSAVGDGWRKIKTILLFIMLAMALFGSLSLLILDPLTLLYRTLTTSLWPALDRLVLALERALYSLPFLANSVASFDLLIRPNLFPPEPFITRAAVLFFGIFTVVIGLNALAKRFWCRYLCPLGGLLGWLSKVALFKRQVSEDCRNCKLCSTACPTGTIDAEHGFASDPAECTLCLDCLDVCPRSTIAITPGWQISPGQTYDISRREALSTLGMGLLSVAVLRSGWEHDRPHPRRIRPPGVLEEAMLSRCIRCGACMRACPTGGLQASLTEAGFEGMWTPILMPRLGYCDYACNACGQACPVEAIPPLSLEEKRRQVIGNAYIDENICIAWADHIDCIVCEEMCPLPEKAIQLTTETFSNGNLESVEVKVPHVLRERCIGCGICEYKCPVAGEAAIRVRLSTG
jgi:polyferredoxin